MPRSIYERIEKSVLQHDRYFMEGKDCTRMCFATTDQKIVFEIIQLSHGIKSSTFLKELRLADSTMPECRKKDLLKQYV